MNDLELTEALKDALIIRDKLSVYDSSDGTVIVDISIPNGDKVTALTFSPDQEPVLASILISTAQDYFINKIRGIKKKLIEETETPEAKICATK